MGCSGEVDGGDGVPFGGGERCPDGGHRVWSDSDWHVAGRGKPPGVRRREKFVRCTEAAGTLMVVRSVVGR